MPDLNYEELNSEYIECFGKYMQSDLLVATTQLFEHTFKPKIWFNFSNYIFIQVVF